MLFIRPVNAAPCPVLVEGTICLKRFIRLAPFLLFRLGLFGIWRRLLPRPLRRTIVRRIVPKIPAREHPLARPVAPAIVVGFLRGTMSFGWYAREVSNIARSADLKVYEFDVGKAFAAEHLPASAERSLVAPPAAVDGDATLIVCVNPDALRYVASFLPPAVFKNKYVIGCCAWELERIPDQWLEPLTLLDEIWVTSEFVRRAFVDSGVSLPCRIVPPQLVSAAAVSPDRARFGIVPNAFVVLLAFGLASSIVRKNPMAAVRAFLKAFPKESDVRLVFKISDIDTEPAAWKAFRAEVGDDLRFVFITDFLTDLDMWSLYASIDVALSTHRAEGYGMVPALAMLSGRAVVATGWSGVLDFMTPDNSILLPYTLVPVKDVDERYVMKNTHWAEVDEDAAAAALRRLYVDPDFRNRLALAGKNSIEAYLERHRNDLVDYLRSWQRSEQRPL